MPRISASVPPPPLAPPASVRAQRRATARPATPATDPLTARAAARPSIAAEPATPDTGTAAATIARLRPVTDLLAALGKTEADLDRWLAAGFGLQTYRTPDGERLADPADLLAALTECRPTDAGDEASTGVAA
jgi:hypothetical protein